MFLCSLAVTIIIHIVHAEMTPDDSFVFNRVLTGTTSVS